MRKIFFSDLISDSEFNFFLKMSSSGHFSEEEDFSASVPENECRLSARGMFLSKFVPYFSTLSLISYCLNFMVTGNDHYNQ